MVPQGETVTLPAGLAVTRRLRIDKDLTWCCQLWQAIPPRLPQGRESPAGAVPGLAPGVPPAGAALSAAAGAAAAPAVVDGSLPDEAGAREAMLAAFHAGGGGFADWPELAPGLATPARDTCSARAQLAENSSTAEEK